MMDDAMLHRLWSKAVGTPGYDRSEWIALEAQLHKALAAAEVGFADVSIDGLAPFVSASDSPLQLPGRDRRVTQRTFGGPSTRRDARLIFDAAQLRKLLDVASSARTSRVVLNQCGVRVDVYESPAGHRYEVWRLVSVDFKPERFALVDG